MDKHKKPKVETTEDVDDIQFDTESEEVSQNDAEGRVKKLKERIKKLEAEKQEYLTGWQKSRAEFVNLRKRDEEEKRSSAKYAAEQVVSDIIPVLDSFESAIGNTEAWERVDKNWRVGVEYIYSQLRSVLEEHGMSEINPLGETFNVAEQEAVEHTPVTNEADDQKVVKVLKRGYRLHGKVVRPAQVAVGEYQKS